MQRRSTSVISATVSLYCLAAISAGHAQELTNTFYVGGGLGTFSYSEDLSPIDPELSNFSGLSAFAWKIYGGVNFNEYFGVEGTYLNSGQFSQRVYGTDPSFGAFDMTATLDFRSLSLRGMGYFPIPWGALFGGLGYFDAYSDLYFTAFLDCCETEFYSSSDRFSGFTGQLGAQWSVSSLVLRAEYEWWDVEGGDASVFMVDASWRF